MQTLPFLKYLINSNLINFTIMLILLGWVLRKINLGKTFEHGVGDVKNTINKSDNAKNDAKKKFDNAKTKFDNLSSDIKILEDNNAEKINIFKKKISDNTDNFIKNLDKNIDKITLSVEKNISNDLQQHIINNIVISAKNNIAELLKQNPELHKKFINDGITELDKVIIK